MYKRLEQIFAKDTRYIKANKYLNVITCVIGVSFSNEAALVGS